MPKVGRRKREAATPPMPKFKPEWINAFIVLMLHKIGGTQAVTLSQLEAYDKVEKGKDPIFAWNEELKAFMITAPEYVLPAIELPPKPKLIT